MQIYDLPLGLINPIVISSTPDLHCMVVSDDAYCDTFLVKIAEGKTTLKAIKGLQNPNLWKVSIAVKITTLLH